MKKLKSYLVVFALVIGTLLVFTGISGESYAKNLDANWNPYILSGYKGNDSFYMSYDLGNGNTYFLPNVTHVSSIYKSSHCNNDCKYFNNNSLALTTGSNISINTYQYSLGEHYCSSDSSMYFYVPFAIFSYSNSTVTVPNACPNPYERNLTVAYNNVSLSLSGLSQNTNLHWGIDQCCDSGTNIYNLKDESVTANNKAGLLDIQLAGLSALELSRFIESLEYLSQLGTAINILSLATSFVNCQHVTTDDPNGIVFTNDSKPAYDLNIPDNTTYNVYCPNGGGEGHTAYINTTGCYSVDGLYRFCFNPNTFGTPGCINLSSTNVLNCEPIQSGIHYKSANADIHIPIVPAYTISGNVCEDGKGLGQAFGTVTVELE